MAEFFLSQNLKNEMLENIKKHKSVTVFNNSNNYLIIIRFVIFLLPTVIVIKYVPCSTLLKSTT